MPTPEFDVARFDVRPVTERGPVEDFDMSLRKLPAAVYELALGQRTPGKHETIVVEGSRIVLVRRAVVAKALAREGRLLRTRVVHAGRGLFVPNIRQGVMGIGQELSRNPIPCPISVLGEMYVDLFLKSLIEKEPLFGELVELAQVRSRPGRPRK